MARVTHVQRAQQRYRTVPVLDEDGQPVYTTTKRVTRKGAVVKIAKTREDRDQPLPDRVCDSCHHPILNGTAYKWVKPKSGPYGGAQRFRHESCPSWHSWELSNSLSAQIDAAEHEFQEAISTASEEGDFKAAADDFASAIRELADAKHEAASNIEDGFGHETEQSSELSSQGDELESWADDIEGFEEPEYPEAGPEDCEECSGSGRTDCDECGGASEILDPESEEGYIDCPECDGTGEIECDQCGGTGEIEQHDPSEEAVEEWAENARNAAEALTEGRPL